MERGKSWRHEGGKFRRTRTGVHEPFLEKQGQHTDDVESRAGDGAVGDKPPSLSTWGGEYAKSMVYGGLDAIVTSFALVASVSGGNLPSGTHGCSTSYLESSALFCSAHAKCSSMLRPVFNLRLVDWQLRC